MNRPDDASDRTDLPDLLSDDPLGSIEKLPADARRELLGALDRLEALAAKSRSESTRRAYRADLEHFGAWCKRFGRSFLPATPDTVGMYVGAIVDEYSLATIERKLAAISSAHRDQGYDSPARVSEPPLRAIWKGLLREKSRAQRKAEPLLAGDLRQIIETLPRAEGGALTTASLRDRALLLVGWAAALRRSELVALTTADLEFVSGEGVNVRVRRSKTDPAGEGLIKGVPYGTRQSTCPVLALRTWLRAAGISEGPIFRRLYRGGSVGEGALSAQSVSRIVKQHVRRIGLKAARFSAHSLRSGFITQAIRAGKRERRVKEHAGHKSWAAFNEYVKRSGTFQENPAEDIGI